MKLLALCGILLVLVKIIAADDSEEKEKLETEETTEKSEKPNDSEKSDDSCSPWPSHLPPLKSCCQTPTKYNCGVEFTCLKLCSEENSNASLDSFAITSEQVDKIRTCMEDCFVKLSDLVTKDRKINKTIAIGLYHDSNPYRINWKPKLVAAAEKCEMGTSESLSANMASFFSCVDDQLVNNCADIFQYSDGCVDVEAHFRKCKKIPVNCTAWPPGLVLPKHCCDTPKLFSVELVSNCTEKCEATEYFRRFQYDCIHECVFEETKVKVDGKYDFEVVKKILNENANKSFDWTNLIDTAVAVCEHNITGERDSRMLNFNQIFSQ